MAFATSVEEKVQERLYTGIEALDRVIGGFPTGTVLIVAGKPGSGSETFLQQVLYNAAVAGKRVTYLTIDRPPEDISAEMQALGWNVEDLISSKKWNFLNGFDLRLKIRQGELGEKVVGDMLQALMKSSKEGDWTAVDSLSRLVEMRSLQEVTAFIDDLLVGTREGRGLHFSLLVEELHDSKTVASLAHSCDGYLRLTLDETRAEPAGTIRIEKLRRAGSVQRAVSYYLGGEGIVIETATRIL